jgi:hypothetical protein
MDHANPSHYRDRCRELKCVTLLHLARASLARDPLANLHCSEILLLPASMNTSWLVGPEDR